MILNALAAILDAGGPVLVYSLLAILVVGILVGLVVIAAVVILIVVLVRNSRKKKAAAAGTDSKAS